MSRSKEELVLVVRDFRNPGFYQIHNQIVDDYRPLIGQAGIDLYNLYARRSMNDTQKAAIPREVIRKHLSLSPSTVTETNLMLEWCELVHIQRAHHRVHGIYLLDAPALKNNPEQLAQIRQNVLEATGGAKPPRPRYPRLRATLLKRLEQWRSLDDLLEEFGCEAKHAIKIIKAGELQLELDLGFNGRDHGGLSEQDHNRLQQQVMEIYLAEHSAEDARRRAEELFEAHCAEVIERQLERWPHRCQIAEESDRGLSSAGALFTWSVKRDEPAWTERKKKEKSAWTEEEQALFLK